MFYIELFGDSSLTIWKELEVKILCIFVIIFEALQGRKKNLRFGHIYAVFQPVVVR